MPIVSINGTIAALPDAPNIYWMKYLDAMTAVRCSGIASVDTVLVFNKTLEANEYEIETYQHNTCSKN